MTTWTTLGKNAFLTNRYISPFLEYSCQSFTDTRMIPIS